MKGKEEDLGITYQDLLQFFERVMDDETSRQVGKNNGQIAGGRWTPFKILKRAAEYYVTNSEEGILRDFLPGICLVFNLYLILLQERTP